MKNKMTQNIKRKVKTTNDVVSRILTLIILLSVPLASLTTLLAAVPIGDYQSLYIKKYTDVDSDLENEIETDKTSEDISTYIVLNNAPKVNLYLTDDLVRNIPEEHVDTTPIISSFTKSTSIHSYSGLNVDEIVSKLSDKPDLVNLAQSIYDTERKYKVNAYFIMAVASLESGYGSSNLASVKNNLFGIRAYDTDPSKYATHFDTKHDSIDYFGELIYNDYIIDRNANTTELISPIYCTTDEWANDVVWLMNYYSNKK